MHLALIFFSLNVRGGSASVFLSLAGELQRQGHSVDVYTYYFDPENCFPELTKNLPINFVRQVGANFRVSDTSLLNKLQLAVDYYWRAKQLYQLIKEKRYDAILASEATTYLPALQHKERSGTPVFWSVFDPSSLIWQRNTPVGCRKIAMEPFLRLHGLAERQSLKKIDKVIVPTQRMKRQMDDFYGINALVLLLAGVREKEFRVDRREVVERRLRDKFGFVKQGEKIIFSNGHFLPHRRYEDALQALKIIISDYPKIKYLIQGSSEFDPVYFVRIKNLVEELGLSSYVWLDDKFKSQEEMVGLFQYADIFLSANSGQTWGLSPFEALICQKPVIITQAMGCSEVLKNNQHALVVPARNPLAIAAALKKLLAHPELANRIAAQGYQLTHNRYTYPKSVQELVAQMSTQ